MEHSYGCGTFTEKDKEASGTDWQLKSLLELSQAEYDLAVQASAALDNYWENAQLFKIVIWNYEDYCNVSGEYLNAFIQKCFLSFSNREPALNLNRYMMNCLSSVRSYLDYVETSIKRSLGKSSSNAAKFKKHCSESFDNKFSYRFLYGLRNYAQHYGLPLTKISFSARAGLNNPTGSECRLEVCIGRDELLNSSFRWGKLTQELAEQPQTIDVNVHLKEMMACLKEIHGEFITDEFVSLRESATLLRGLLQRIPSDYDELHLFHLSTHSTEPPADRVNVKMQVVRLDLIEDVFDHKFAALFEEE